MRVSVSYFDHFTSLGCDHHHMIHHVIAWQSLLSEKIKILYNNS